ncbi:MAG: SRPBCC family protein [Hyphomicrobiaceae bacterium]
MPSTIRLHRVLRASAERVYRAFTDRDALVKWLPPNGYTATMHSFEAKVGGGYRMSFTSLASGKGHSFEVRFLELVPARRIVHTDRFDDPGLPGEMRVEISFEQVSVGTEITIVQAGVPDVIPPDACYVGWQQSLALLALLVEAET